MSNVDTVQEIYGAFGRGDIPAILEHMDEAVEWDYSHEPNEVPWLQARKGRDGTAGFFQSLGAVEFHSFVPKTFLEGPDLVVVLVDVDFTVKRTGRRVTEEDEVHIWRFDSGGRVVRFRHATDTLQNVNAWRG